MSTQSKKANEEIKTNIVSAFGIDKLPNEEQAETLGRVGNLIFQGVLLRVLPLLEKEDLAEYESLLEKNVMPEELMDFFFDKVPDFLTIVADETNEFRKEAEKVLSEIKK